MAENDSRLVHVEDESVFNRRICQLFADRRVSFDYLGIYCVIMPVPWKCSHPASFELWVTFVETLRPIFAWRLLWSIVFGPAASDGKGYRRYVLDANGCAESRHLQDEIDHGLLFIWCEVLLALSLGFDRPLASGTVVQGGAGDVAMICKGAIRSRYA